MPLFKRTRGNKWKNTWRCVLVSDLGTHMTIETCHSSHFFGICGKLKKATTRFTFESIQINSSKSLLMIARVRRKKNDQNSSQKTNRCSKWYLIVQLAGNWTWQGCLCRFCVNAPLMGSTVPSSSLTKVSQQECGPLPHWEHRPLSCVCDRRRHRGWPVSIVIFLLCLQIEIYRWHLLCSKGEGMTRSSLFLMISATGNRTAIIWSASPFSTPHHSNTIL